MTQKKSHVLLGLFVIAGAFLTGGAITLLGARSAFRDGVMMETYFDESVNGLEVGSPVKLRGVTIGEVTLVTMLLSQYPSQPSNYAMVRAEIFPELLGISGTDSVEKMTEDLIQQGLRIKLTAANITGTAYLEAVYVDLRKEAAAGGRLQVNWTPRDLYVPATKSTLVELKSQLDKVLENLERTDIAGVVDQAKTTMATIDRAIRDADVPALRKSIGTLVADASRALDSIQTQVQNLGSRAQKTLTHADGALANAETAIAKMDKLLGKPELERAIARSDKLTEDAGMALADFNKLVKRTNHAVANVQNAVHGRGRDVADIANGLRELVDHLSMLSGTLDKHPSLLFFGKPPSPARKTSETNQADGK